MNKYEMQREARQKEVIKQVLLGMAESGELHDLIEKHDRKTGSVSL